MQHDAADNARETSLKRYAWLSIAAAVATIGLKGGAWLLTDSVGLLSDAAESLVNLVAAIVALYALSVAEKPADDEHAYGHTKVEYFSSGFEGALILVAALAIGVTAFQRLLDPQPVTELTAGATIALVASAINLFVARVLLRVGREHRSLALEADSRHLMTDVWTTAGVIVGVGLASFTGQGWLDPLVAIAVALNILREGGHLVQRSVGGLMDRAQDEDDVAQIEELEQLGYTDVWSAETDGADAFTPLALASQWAPSLRLGTAIVPAYTLNRVLGSIPLLGALLTGGEGSGLFAGFTVAKGPGISAGPRRSE